MQITANDSINTYTSPLRGVKLVLLLIAVLLLAAHAEADQLKLPEPPYSIEKLRAWHKAMEPWPWLGQPEQEVYLRNDKRPQLLLAKSGYARGVTYILFAERDGTWSQVSDEIEQAHHPLHMLKDEHDGWHDFESFVPLWGSGGEEVSVSTYSWNEGKYVLKSRKASKFCDFEPFKGNTELCPVR